MVTAEAIQAIYASGGEIFTVEFVKRSTGEVRKMNARLGVTKHLKGGDLKYDPKEHALITVFDMQKKGYRSIATEGITKLTLGGETHDVVPETPVV